MWGKKTFFFLSFVLSAQLSSAQKASKCYWHSCWIRFDRAVMSFFFTEDISTCNSRKSTVERVRLMMAGFNLAASVSGSWYCACCLTVTLSCLRTLEYYGGIVNAISNTCAFPMTTQNVCCEKALFMLQGLDVISFPSVFVLNLAVFVPWSQSCYVVVEIKFHIPNTVLQFLLLTRWYWQ